MKRKSKTAYLLSEGCYSDYCIIGVFLDKEKAEKALKLRRTTDQFGDARLAEFEINETVQADHLFVVKYPYDTLIRAYEGDVETLVPTGVDNVFKDPKNAKIVVRVHASGNFERAKKTYYDQVAKYKAFLEGL